MRTMIVAAAAATAFATPAFAQEQVAAPFNGGHVDLIGGFDRINADGEGATGALYGIAAGYDVQRGAGVFGVEAEIADSSASECEGGVCVKTGRDLYIGGRAGVVVSDAALLYVKAGYTNARFVAEGGGLSAGTNLDGIRGGVGIEVATGSALTVRVEYRYSNYEADVSRHQGVLGLGIRF
jgi:outer membrane immunogenic protein